MMITTYIRLVLWSLLLQLLIWGMFYPGEDSPDRFDWADPFAICGAMLVCTVRRFPLRKVAAIIVLTYFVAFGTRIAYCAFCEALEDGLGFCRWDLYEGRRIASIIFSPFLLGLVGLLPKTSFRIYPSGGNADPPSASA